MASRKEGPKCVNKILKAERFCTVHIHFELKSELNIWHVQQHSLVRHPCMLHVWNYTDSTSKEPMYHHHWQYSEPRDIVHRDTTDSSHRLTQIYKHKTAPQRCKGQWRRGRGQGKDSNITRHGELMSCWYRRQQIHTKWQLFINWPGSMYSHLHLHRICALSFSYWVVSANALAFKIAIFVL